MKEEKRKSEQTVIKPQSVQSRLGPPQRHPKAI